MKIKKFTFNPIQENTYLLYDETNEAVVIDAGMTFENEREAIKQFIDENNLQLKQVLNTHLHFDHVFGNKFLYDTYHIQPEGGKEDEFMLGSVKESAAYIGIQTSEEAQPLGKYLSENEIIRFGNTELKAFSTPGHSPGSFCFYCEKGGVVFVGDVLFRNSIGRTDFLKGDYDTLIRSIRTKLLTLPDSTVVYSGHGIETTIGYEKIHNPYLQMI
jgi:glyoxylase-like metal-dependent hydrolase (beta-lactamase superfamily II)